MNKSSVAYLFRRIALIEKFGTEEAADFFLAEEAKQRAIEALRLIKAAHKVEQRADPAIFREAREAGPSERTIKRAKAELHAESLKEKAGWVWALPPIEAKGAKEAKKSKPGNLGTVGTLGTVADEAKVF